jgi:diacylglycerol kinase family enzyme
MRSFALVNPASGDARWSAVLPELRRTCDDVHVVRRGDDLSARVRRAVAEGAELVVAVGGDGTVSAVADVTAVTGTLLVVVPTGTRNHFAVDLGVDPTDPLRTLRASLAGEERRVDVGDVDGGIFLNNVSFGVYARAVRDASYRNGRLTTLASYARRAMAGHGHRVEVRTQLPADVPADARVGAILVSNNAYDFFAAPGAKLRSCLDAGELWVYLLGLPRFRRPFPLLRAVSEVVTAGSFTVGAWPAAEQVVHADRPLPVAEDGEYRHDLTPPYRLSIRPGALRVLAPTRGSAPRSLTLRW